VRSLHVRSWHPILSACLPPHPCAPCSAHTFLPSTTAHRTPKLSESNRAANIFYQNNFKRQIFLKVILVLKMRVKRKKKKKKRCGKATIPG
jgi:hypothetical protein